MTVDLRGRRALVSGGTHGAGRLIVEVLVASGASVVFCGSDVVAGELLQDGLMVADDQTVGFHKFLIF